jgi:hypothetical protein
VVEPGSRILGRRVAEAQGRDGALTDDGADLEEDM